MDIDPENGKLSLSRKVLLEDGKETKDTGEKHEHREKREHRDRREHRERKR